MRLSELYLDGFGHFHQQAIGPTSGAVTVLYGPNEAGKSTLLAFIRAILFGFPRAYNNHYPPLVGGRHGGRIVMNDDAGASFVVERYAGSRGGLNVASPEGPSANSEALLRRLTGNATPDLFRNVFAFSLDELQAAASLNDSSGAIYSAGQGAPGLPALTRSLGEQRGRIYLPRGNNQRVPSLLNELRGIDEQLRIINGHAALYGDLTSRKTVIDRELQEGEATLLALNAKQARVSALINGWDDWLALSDCQSQLQLLPKYEDFPENAVPRLEHLETQSRQASEDWDEAVQLLRRSEEAATSVIANEDLLFDRERIESIRRRRGSLDDSVKDLPERRKELESLESELTDRLRGLGPSWDECRLQSFDTSMEFRQEVEQGKEALTRKHDVLQRAEQRLEQDQRTLEDLQTAADEAKERMPSEPPLDSATLQDRRESLRAARARLGEYERANQNFRNLSGQLDYLTTDQEVEANSSPLSLLLPAILAVAGIALIVAGLVLGGAAAMVGVLGGIALLAAGVVLALGRRSAPTENPVAAALRRQSGDAERMAGAAWHALLEATQSLAVDGEPSGTALDGAETRLDVAQTTFTAWSEARVQLEDRQRRVRLQQDRVQSASEGSSGAKHSLDSTQREWQEWLAQRGLPAGFSPDAVVDFAGRMESTRVKLEQVRENRRRVAAIEYDIQEFREQVEPLAQSHAIALDPEDNGRLALVADELIRRLDEAQTAFHDRERAKEQADDNRQLLEARERRLKLAKEALASLLATGGTDEPEEFRRRARQQEDRTVLERQLGEHRRSLEHFSGPGERFKSFCRELTAAEPDQLSQNAERLSERRSELEELRDKLREERGGIDTELTQLVSEEESSSLRGRRNTLLEQLREEARGWSRLTIAETLLERTRQKFEQERQPSVVRHAQDFFSRVTGHRYNRLFAPIGEQTITVVDSTGARKQPHELSRGTREQLYLALRFGLIREFGEGAERLPVVVDEALVNFDPGRARLAAEAFGQLAETNQVLVFTCHPATADMFAEAAGAQVVDIAG